MEQQQPNRNWLIASLYARRGVLTSLAILAGLGFALHSAWEAWGPSIARTPRYLVTPDSVAITPPPEWVRDDPVKVAFDHPRLAEGVSILAPPEELETPLGDAFASHPWVKRVGAVRKSPPNRVELEILYRTPVAAVLTAEGLAPADTEGVRLPAEDLSREFVQWLPRIGVASGDYRDLSPGPLPIDPWPTAAVAGAAAIVEGLGAAFNDMHLHEVQIEREPHARAGKRFLVYRLRSRGNSLVVWGAAPNQGPPDEASPETKLQRLREAIRRHGPLDSVETAMLIDVRDGVSAWGRVAKLDEVRLAEQPAEGDTVK